MEVSCSCTDTATMAEQEQETSIPDVEKELYFDNKEMRWKTRHKQTLVSSSSRTSNRVVALNKSTERESSGDAFLTSEGADAELYFDDNEMRWKRSLQTCRSCGPANSTNNDFDASEKAKPKEEVANATMVSSTFVLLVCCFILLKRTARRAYCTLPVKATVISF